MKPAGGVRRAVTVIGSGRDDHPATRPLGRALAQAGYDLVTGGGRGVMAGVSRSFFETPGRDGRVIGILPADPDQPGAAPPGYPNPWVEVTIRTHLPGRGAGGGGADSRNHLVVLSGEVIVALPGGPGTRSELELAHRYGRPALLLGWPPGEPAGIVPDGTNPGAGMEPTRFGEIGPLLDRLGRLLARSAPQSPPVAGAGPRPPQPPNESRM